MDDPLIGPNGGVAAQVESEDAGGPPAASGDSPPGGVPQTRAAALDAGAQMLQFILDEVRGLRKDFETKLLYDETKQRQLDTMHAELQDYRNGLRFHLLRATVDDLITLRDDLSQVATRLRREHGDEGVVNVAVAIEHFRDQVEEILRRADVEMYMCPGDVFDRERQRAIGVVATNDPALDKRVAERLRPGFLYEGRRVVRPEQVTTYGCEPQAVGE